MREGKVLSVTTKPTKTEAEISAAQNDTVLYVYDNGDFEESGSILVKGTELVYTSRSDDEVDTSVFFTIAAPLPFAVEEDEDVFPVPQSYEKIALVDVDGMDDAQEVRVPHDLYDKLEEGVRLVSKRETVIVDDSDEEDLTVYDVIGMEPTVDGQYLTYIPPPADVPPTLAPVPEVIGGIKILHVLWPPIEGTSLTIQVHMSETPGFTAVLGDPATMIGETAGTSYTIEQHPNGDALDSSKTYYVSLIAYNSALPGGTSPSSPVAGSLKKITSPDIAIDAAWVGTMAVDRLTGGDLQAEQVVVRGTKGVVAIGAGGEEVGLYPTGFKVKGSISNGSPTYIDFPVNGAPNIISGILKATTLEVAGDPNNGNKAMSLLGFSELSAGAELRMATGIKAPLSPPLAETASKVTQVVSGATPATTFRGGFYEASTDRFYYACPDAALNDIYYVKSDGTGHGSLSLAGLPANYSVLGATAIGLNYFVLYTISGVPTSQKALFLAKFSSAWTFQSSVQVNMTTQGGQTDWIDQSGIGNDGTSVLVGTFEKFAVDRFIHVSRYNASTLVYVSKAIDRGFLDSPWPFDNIQAILYGSFDFGAPRYVIQVTGDTVRLSNQYSVNVFDNAGARVYNDTWEDLNVVASLYWKTDRFYSLSKDGQSIFQYSKYWWSGTSKRYWRLRQSKYRATPTAAETDAGPATTSDLVVNKRTWVKVTTSHPDTPRSRVYASAVSFSGYNPTNTDYTRQGESADNMDVVWIEAYNNLNPGLPTNTFTASSPAQIVSTDGSTYWKSDGVAKFLQLIVSSTEEVTTASSNKPPLRIGDPAGNHLRADGNEIQSMGTDSATALLRLQEGGGGTKIGSASKNIMGIRWNIESVSFSGGLGTINHGLGAVPETIVISPHGTANVRVLSVHAKDASTFTVRQKDQTNANVNGTTDVSWIAIA